MALSRAFTAMTIAATLALGAAGCGNDDVARDDRPANDARAGGAPPADPVQFRRVLAMTEDTSPDPVQPDPAAEAVACAPEAGYRLAPAEIVGGVEDAEVQQGQGRPAWSIMIELDDDAAATFADLTRELNGTGQQLAVVLGGRVLTAPVIQAVITDGRVSIAGDFTRDEAESLADALEG
ncbi:SecDF P1 head subdomain-containing protein [Nocardioides nitrophenolicus]|uniref:SecDF P1 head subdomain-containing protein n=1 Tax=Nocardioides nitrophenolicus TaxID=60489 RepID=UPI0019579CD5|nr:hypothetical protein [Nocardioides nitrophenolicus]MBM7516666.1 preprotein translocase subunit SecD [Nocardioides nitrophenolicus]